MEKTLQTRLYATFLRVLRREYFFEVLSFLYEQVAAVKLSCHSSHPVSSIRLDARVEAALAKAAKVWEPTQIYPRSAVNLKVLAPFWPRRKDWERKCGCVKVITQQKIQEAEKAETRFMSIIGRTRRKNAISDIDTAIVAVTASYKLLTQAQQTIVGLPLAAFLVKRTEELGESLWICDWLHRELPSVRVTVKNTVPYLSQFVQSDCRAAAYSFTSECELLSHLKHVNDSDLKKVLSVYAACAVYELQSVAVQQSLLISREVSVARECLRVLHSVVVKGGRQLLTMCGREVRS